MTFKLNEIFYEETMDGRKIKSIIVMENDSKFIQNQYDDDNVVLTVIWEFSEAECVMTLTFKEIVYKRWFAVVH
jgi:fatty acid-binding protein 3